MTADVVTIHEDATAEHCAHLMEEHGVKRLPAVRDGRLVGAVSRADLLLPFMEPPGKIGAEARDRDERIREALRKEMHQQPWAESLWSFADVEDAVVTLYGFVRSDATRRDLRVLASRIDGVERVDDRMEDVPIWVGDFFLGPPGTAETRDPVPSSDGGRRPTASPP